MDENVFNLEKDVLHISIIVTGRCNASCEYCHFFANKNKKDIWKDISDDLYKKYIEIIKYLKNEKKIKNLTFRFSGGEPLVMGNKMFELANYAYNEIGIKPYILTNGKLVNKENIDKAIKNNIQAFVVSLENPFEIAKGAVPLEESMPKIKKYNSESLPIIPGAVVVGNSMFSNLEKICDYFYDEIGQIPTISEKTFYCYNSPTIQEYKELKVNIKNIVKKYLGKTRLELFPYIIPEFNSKRREFLVELDLNGNNIDLNDSTENNALKLLKQISKSYPKLNCKNKDCQCYDGCDYCKWVWLKQINDTKVETKREDYCKFKKTLYDAIEEGLKEIKSKTA